MTENAEAIEHAEAAIREVVQTAQNTLNKKRDGLRRNKDNLSQEEVRRTESQMKSLAHIITLGNSTLGDLPDDPSQRRERLYARLDEIMHLTEGPH